MKEVKKSYEKYLNYLNNVEPCPLEWFDEDWAPAGKMIRKQLSERDLIEIRGKRIYTTDEIIKFSN